MNEEELAVFDLLTKPEPELTDGEREQVKAVAKQLLEHVHERLVLDWRRKAETLASVRVAIREVLDRTAAGSLSAELYDAKVQVVFDHIRTAYGDDGTSVYEQPEKPVARLTVLEAPLSVDEITESVVGLIKNDPAFAELVARQLRGAASTFALIDRRTPPW